MPATSIENADSKPFWEGARQGRLVMQHCPTCGRTQFPPCHMCARCWATELEWRECSGSGTVESFTIVRRAPTADMRDKVPYVVAAIILAEGPRVMTNIIGPDALQAAIGDEVRVTFETDQYDRVLPQFKRVTAGGS